MKEKARPKFKLPAIAEYDGSADPIDHLDAYREWADIYDIREAIRCRVFSFTLTGSARNWFRQLKRNSISSFKELAEAFVTQFVGGRVKSKPVTYLLTIKQKATESLKEYVARFNEEKLQVEGLTDAVALIAFVSGVKDERLVFSFGKRTPGTFMEALSRAQKYMSAGELIHLSRDLERERANYSTKRERRGEKRHRSSWERSDSGHGRLVQRDPQLKFEKSRMSIIEAYVGKDK
ncbi:uncharacterized protein LOC111024851 [Momordica charantia]|uniref:Uncharacterized protein LOC111024851 n=1 Tax=Momordica charantia TaxID=3673 RepID=A0A6J1DZ49_MOMCH|nr:uncharacterized protein LOC111024851 [Momordica charantia]